MEHFDVVIVGAGLSGIGAAAHLQMRCPGHTFVLLEGRNDIGGTWDLFRYPGVRSDSDMHTLGYSFKPWTADKAIADAPSIMAYLRETVAERAIGQHIRFGHQVHSASWDSATARWTVTTSHDDNERVFTCSFLMMCSGYYRYGKGHSPEFPGRERFAGTLVHPQQWPADLDHSGKRVVVIGSGATAMTLVPAMADTAANVTMLQRTPTYVVARPDRDAVANALRAALPDGLAYRITRWKNTTLQQFFYRQSRRHPDRVKRQLLKGVRAALGPEFDVDRHFTPAYGPWDQRLCLVPNGDLFTAIRDGKASVVTDRIRSFTETGIELESGQHLDADIIVTATGLDLVTLGEVAFSVDGEPVDFSRTWTYKGFAYSDVPNLASVFGYVNASWTLRADLISEYVCRLLLHMQATGTDQCTPRLRSVDQGMPERPWIDDFRPGYIERSLHEFPRQGNHEPWLNPQDYRQDRRMFLSAPVDDGAMQFTRVGAELDAR